jgi:hypothetical protein
VQGNRNECERGGGNEKDITRSENGRTGNDGLVNEKGRIRNENDITDNGSLCGLNSSRDFMWLNDNSIV